jgi:glycosyltransferase involved in cell wall biosynthesis
MNKKSNILFLDNSFTFGGAINSLSHLLQALNRNQFEPIVVSGQPHKVLKQIFPGISCYHYLPKLTWINNRIYTQISLMPLFKIRLFKILLNLFRFCYWLLFVHFPEALYYVRLGKRHNISLIHLNNILGSQLSGILAAKFLGVPCVAHLRDFEKVHPVTRIYAKFIDHHIAISNAIRDNILQLGVPADNITLVHDAIDLNSFNIDIDCDYLMDEFSLNDAQPRFGIFGRLIDWKGIREFIVATKQVVEHIPNTKSFIVGGASDGDEDFLKEMIDLTKTLGLENNIIFTGFRTDVPALMKFMHVIVHASITPEPFGMVLIEGMAMGRPIVATRAGGPLDIVIDGQTGILVPMGDANELAKAVISLLDKPATILEMGSNGAKRVSKYFNSNLYAAKVGSIYKNLT